MKILYTNCKLYSLSGAKGDSLAAVDGNIFEIGSKTSMISLKRRGFKQIDLKGQTVLPGFIDSHLHLLSTGYNLMSVDLDNVASMRLVLKRIEAAAKKLKPGQWLRGRGWNRNLWGGEFPTRILLDQVCPRNPAMFYSKDGHAAWVNTLALKQSSIKKSSLKDHEESVLSFSDGTPSGIFFESAIDLIADNIPSPTSDIKLKALSKAVKYLNENGITGVADCDWYPDRLEILQAAQAKGSLDLRVFMMLAPAELDAAIGSGLRTGFGDNFITIGALKLYCDGSIGSQTAWMSAAYKESPGSTGVRTLSDEQLDMYFEKTHLHGISLAVHAIGDRANTRLLDFFGRKARISAKMGLNHRIEHAQILKTADIKKFARYNVSAAVQPIHLVSDRDMSYKYLGKRESWCYRFNDLLKSGAKFGFGTDAPIEAADPIRGLHAAVARKGYDDKRGGWNIDQKLTLNQAVTAYTKTAADICSWSGKSGVLAEGARADFVVLNRDIFKTGLKDFRNIRVIGTAVAGKLVYKSKELK